MGFEVGQKVGDYEIVSILGAGGMGRVYRVRNLISNRTEAMKVLLPDLTAEPELASRFLSEIRTLAGFDHPNIAQLHTAFQTGNELVMMMEFVEGSSLAERARLGPIPQDAVVDDVQQVLAALSYAHSRGVIHRDIKPANIMVTPQGVVKLMDFGIAKSKVEENVTLPGTTIGSLYYMSPEQVRGETVDARSDIYSVGVMMYELLAGRKPFEADSAYNVLNKQLNVSAQPPIEVNPQLSQTLSDLILNAMAKDPAQRFQNAAAFSNALRHVTGRTAETPTAQAPAFAPVVVGGADQAVGQGVAPLAAAPPMALRPPSGGHRALWITTGAVAVLIVLIGAAVGLPHFLKTGAMPKTGSDSSTQTSSAPVPSGGGAAAVPVPASHPSDATPPSDSTPPSNSVPPGETPNDVPAQPTPAQPAPAQPDPPQPQADLDKVSPQQAAKPKLPRAEYHPAPPSAPMTQASGAAPTPAAAAPTEAEVEQLRSQKVALDARAGAVSTSVETLKRQQEADGLGLRQDMAGAYARMNVYLRAANIDLDNGNVTAARGHMDKAEKEVTILEGLFGR